jgi:hypothetical protein
LFLPFQRFSTQAEYPPFSDFTRRLIIPGEFCPGLSQLLLTNAKTGMLKFSKNLESSSKLQAPEGWHETRF